MKTITVLRTSSDQTKLFMGSRKNKGGGQNSISVIGVGRQKPIGNKKNHNCLRIFQRLLKIVSRL